MPRPRSNGGAKITGWFVATPGHFPLIRRVPRHLPPQGEGFCGGQPHKKYDVTGNSHGRAMLAPTAQGVLALYGLTMQPP